MTALQPDPQGSPLHQAIPETWDAFRALHRSAVAEGEVPTRLKEAAALAMSALKGCEGCIEHHARAAARAGATPAEIAEMLGVALLMEGGPVTVHGPKAWKAYQQAAERRGRLAS